MKKHIQQFQFTLALVLMSVAFNFMSAQGGAKWTTGLNGISAGDALGTSNNFALNFYTNNSQRMSLGTNGVLQINGLSGTSFRFLQTDASGNLIAFPMGTASQVLYGNGTWGPLPASATTWGVNGNNIYTTNSGNVGIGNSNPTYKLDITGDVRISNNLLVGGGIITSQTVNATGEVNGGGAHILNDISVGGNGNFAVDVTVGNKLNVGPAATSNFELSYVPSSGPNIPNVSYFNKTNNSFPPPAVINTCVPFSVALPSFVNAFNDQISLAYVNQNATYLAGGSILDMGANAGTSYITSRFSPLTINGDCPENIYLMGAKVGFGTNAPTERFTFDNGNVLIESNGTIPQAVTASRFKSKGGNIRAATLETNHNYDLGINTLISVNRLGTRAFDIINTDVTNGGDYFHIWGSGQTYIGKNMYDGNFSMLTVGQANHNDLALSLVDNNSSYAQPRDFFNVYGSGYTEIKIYNPSSMPSPGGSPRVFTIRDVSNANPSLHKDIFAINSNGKTYAREVEISLTATFPDYVFKKDYKLKTIGEVAEYIDQNKHLPGFEKAEYYEKNGLNVNDMFIKQQEKIEELTLYIIELEKRLKAIEQTNQKSK
jgi:hypothetical protein